MFSIVSIAAEAIEFTADTYPNPKTVQGARECNMRAVSNVCDPDQVLSESSRYRFNQELQQMAKRTERVTGSFCDRQGFEPLLLIAHEGTQELADAINEKWNLDGHCKKSVIFFLSALDHSFYYSTEPDTGFDQTDFIAIKISQESFLAEGNYTFALTNIFKQIGGAQNIQVTSEDKETDYKNHHNATSAVERTSLSTIVNSLVALSVLVPLMMN
uniref:TPM_phosphatase domain-containing protein n=1 Tax=Panagrellus redivivus TaxID=6233 RepID=A0A7E4VV35_PANRE